LAELGFAVEMPAIFSPTGGTVMPMIELKLSLVLAQAHSAPQARVWLDLEPDQGLNSEVELALWSSGKGQWRGRFTLDEGRHGDFSYRVGLFAHAEAEWSLSFRSCNLGAELLTDGDRLASPKAWLIGSCSAQPRERSAAPPAAPSQRASSQPRLRLLRGGADARPQLDHERVLG
jgi:hypothetical protein